MQELQAAYTAGAFTIAIAAVELAKVAIGKLSNKNGRGNGTQNGRLELHDLTTGMEYLKNKMSHVSNKTDDLHQWHDVVDPTTGVRPWMTGPFFKELKMEIKGMREELSETNTLLRQSVQRGLFSCPLRTSSPQSQKREE